MNYLDQVPTKAGVQVARILLQEVRYGNLALSVPRLKQMCL